MAKTKDKQPLLTLEDKKYFQEDLSDEEIKMVAHLRNVEDKLQSNMFVQDQLLVTKEAFISRLKDSINKEEEKDGLD